MTEKVGCDFWLLKAVHGPGQKSKTLQKGQCVWGEGVGDLIERGEGERGKTVGGTWMLGAMQGYLHWDCPPEVSFGRQFSNGKCTNDSDVFISTSIVFQGFHVSGSQFLHEFFFYLVKFPSWEVLISLDWDDYWDTVKSYPSTDNFTGLTLWCYPPCSHVSMDTQNDWANNSFVESIVEAWTFEQNLTSRLWAFFLMPQVKIYSKWFPMGGGGMVLSIEFKLISYLNFLNNAMIFLLFHFLPCQLYKTISPSQWYDHMD